MASFYIVKSQLSFLVNFVNLNVCSRTPHRPASEPRPDASGACVIAGYNPRSTLSVSKPDGDLPLLSRNMRFNRPTDPHVPHGPRARQQGGYPRCSDDDAFYLQEQIKCTIIKCKLTVLD